MNSLLLFWLIIGAAVAIYVIMMHTLGPKDHPPPESLGRFIGILVAGILGALLGGLAVHRLDSGSNLLPGILGAAAAGLIFSGGLAFLIGFGRAAR